VAILDIIGLEEAARKLGERAFGICADVSDEPQMRTAIDTVIDRYGRLDIMVNNAGIEGTIAPLSEYGINDFDHCIAVNLRGVFLGMYLAMPHLIASTHGTVVNIASVAAIRGFIGMSAYCAAKAGVVGMTRAAALDHGKDGVRINAVLPGVVQTPAMKMLFDAHPEIDQATRDKHPIGRYGVPKELAAAVAFLCSDDAAFMTGSIVTVDGGYTAA
jgi:NAD(P)-dependent dehydrogenase (short-subunit alcohol dehydrogenase family)